jgi:hypothetical protein
MAFLAMGDQAVRDAGQGLVCAIGQIYQGIAQAFAIQQLERGQGVLSSEHGVYQNVYVLHLHNEGCISELGDFHGAIVKPDITFMLWRYRLFYSQ